MSIESFAAVVGDNDGAAFITKTEFDSLKNNFQSQIDQYNTSIDSKIDGAIASYLSGLQIQHEKKLPLLVRNYNDLKWQKSWKLYGKYKRWSNRTTISKSVNDDWFEPSSDRRLNWRDEKFELYDKLQHGFAVFHLFLAGKISGLNGGLLLIKNSPHGTTGEQQTAPVLALRYKWDDIKSKYIIDSTQPFINIFSLNYHINTYIHQPTETPTYFWQYEDYNLRLDETNAQPIQSLNTVDAVWDIYINTLNTDGSKRQFRDTVTADRVSFPTFVSSREPYDEAGFASSPYAHNFRSSLDYDSLYTDNGCSWSYPDGTYKDELDDAFLNLALGDNNEQKINIYQLQYEHVNGERQVASDQTAYCGFTGALTKGYFQNLKMKSSTGASVLTLNEPFTLRIPLLPQIYVRDMVLNDYEYNSKPLQAGAGLPLYLDSDGTYSLQISFDYTINNILTDADLTNTYSLAIDLKKGDFLDQSIDNRNYYEAYDGLVDPNTTSLSSHLYKKYEYPKKTGQVKITVPIKAADSVWLRVCPNTDTAGIYAKLRNLNLTLVS